MGLLKVLDIQIYLEHYLAPIRFGLWIGDWGEAREALRVKKLKEAFAQP
jgi:hypothetical protein